MHNKFSKRFTLWILIFGLVSIAFGCISVVNNYNQKHPSERSPIHTLIIHVEESQRKKLFDQLEKFSEAHNLKYHLSFYKDNEIFFVEMYGETFHIAALSKPMTTSELEISMFEEDPTNPTPMDLADVLFDDLKSSLEEIPGLIILDEK